MPTKAVESAINDQIAKEFYAAHLYLSMAAWFEDRNLPGFAKWMRVQNDEERAHAMRLFDYLIEAGGRVRLKALEAPPTDFTSPLKVMEASLAHEKKVTASIRKLYELAARSSTCSGSSASSRKRRRTWATSSPGSSSPARTTWPS